MELHHSKHHQTYVNSYNDATEKLASATANGNIAAQIALQPLINFHGGGNLNHTLFWENLAPRSQGGGDPPAGELEEAIRTRFGGLDEFKGVFNTALAGIQGSGWAWLVRDTQTGDISVRTYAVGSFFLFFLSVALAVGWCWVGGYCAKTCVQNQDPVVGRFKPLLGIDAWEHAY